MRNVKEYVELVFGVDTGTGGYTAGALNTITRKIFHLSTYGSSQKRAKLASKLLTQKMEFPSEAFKEFLRTGI